MAMFQKSKDADDFLGSPVKIKSRSEEEEKISIVKFYASLHKFPRLEGVLKIPKSHAENSSLKQSREDAINAWTWLRNSFNSEKFAKEFGIDINKIAEML